MQHIDVAAYEQHQLALENVVSEFFVQGSAAFKSFMSHITDTFKFAGSAADLPDIKELPQDQRNFIKVLDGVPYASMTRVRAYTPQGLVGMYLPYAHALLKMSAHVKMVEKTVIDPYIFFMSQVVSDPKVAESARDDASMFTRHTHEREALYKEISHYFAKGCTKSESTIGEVISRHGDWPAVFKTIHQLICDVQSVNRANLKSKISQGVDLANVIASQYGREDSKHLSKQTAHKLGDYTFYVAQELQMYSDVHFRILALQGAVQNTMQSISEIYS